MRAALQMYKLAGIVMVAALTLTTSACKTSQAGSYAKETPANRSGDPVQGCESEWQNYQATAGNYGPVVCAERGPSPQINPATGEEGCMCGTQLGNGAWTFVARGGLCDRTFANAPLACVGDPESPSYNPATGEEGCMCGPKLGNGSWTFVAVGNTCDASYSPGDWEAKAPVCTAKDHKLIPNPATGEEGCLCGPRLASGGWTFVAVNNSCDPAYKGPDASICNAKSYKLEFNPATGEEGCFCGPNVGNGGPGFVAVGSSCVKSSQSAPGMTCSLQGPNSQINPATGEDGCMCGDPVNGRWSFVAAGERCHAAFNGAGYTRYSQCKAARR